MDLPTEPIIVIFPMPFISEIDVIVHIQRPGHAYAETHRSYESPPITLDAASLMPLYKQLYERLREAILEGQLQRGVRLPSTHTLASEISVSRNTTALAYEQLLGEGFLESKVGKGTAVACQLPTTLVHEHIDRTRETHNVMPQKAPVRLASRVRPLLEMPHADGAESSSD